MPRLEFQTSILLHPDRVGRFSIAHRIGHAIRRKSLPIALTWVIGSLTVGCGLRRQAPKPSGTHSQTISMKQFHAYAGKEIMTLDAPKPVGGWVNTDSLDWLSWLQTIAKEWDPNARFRGAIVFGMRPDGSVSLLLSGEPGAVVAVFVSSANPSVKLSLRAEKESVVAQVEQLPIWKQGNQIPDGFPASVPTRQVLDSLRAAGGTPESHEFCGVVLWGPKSFMATLGFNRKFGWCWSVIPMNTPQTRAIPQVKASDGSIIP